MFSQEQPGSNPGDPSLPNGYRGSLYMLGGTSLPRQSMYSSFPMPMESFNDSVQTRSDVLKRLFAHEIVRPSSPVTGYLCVRGDHTHPSYPRTKWLPGTEHKGHFILSTQPLGSLAWLDPADRLGLRVAECAVAPDSIIGGSQGTVEAQRVMVSAERPKPLGPYTETLQTYWSSLRSTSGGPAAEATAVQLASDALLRFRLYGKFACRGISFVSEGVNRTGWLRPADGAPCGWHDAWTTACTELNELRNRALHEAEWMLLAGGVDELITGKLSTVTRAGLLRDHVILTSYAVAAGPASARLNPFAPLVSLNLMGCSPLGLVGEWFWLGVKGRLVGHRSPLHIGFRETESLPLVSAD